MKFIQKYKVHIIIGLIFIILLILASVAVYKMFYPNSGIDKYDSRMDGSIAIDEVAIEKIKTDIIALGTTTSVEYRENGPMLKFIIKLVENTDTNSIKAITPIITNNLSTEVLNFYDIEIYFSGEGNSELPIIAYKSKWATSFDYALNKEVTE